MKSAANTEYLLRLLLLNIHVIITLYTYNSDVCTKLYRLNFGLSVSTILKKKCTVRNKGNITIQYNPLMSLRYNNTRPFWTYVNSSYSGG